MRLKGYLPAKPKNVESDCGMGMKELRAEIREIQAITMLPKCMTNTAPAWKKPVIIASLLASIVGVCFSAAAMYLNPPVCGSIFIASMAWSSFVLYANRERRTR